MFVSLKVDHLRSIDNYSVTVNHLPEFCKEEVGRFIVAAIIFITFFSFFFGGIKLLINQYLLALDCFSVSQSQPAPVEIAFNIIISSESDPSWGWLHLPCVAAMDVLSSLQFCRD